MGNREYEVYAALRDLRWRNRLRSLEAFTNRLWRRIMHGETMTLLMENEHAADVEFRERVARMQHVPHRRPDGEGTVALDRYFEQVRGAARRKIADRQRP